MDRLSNLWGNCIIKGKEPTWTWQDLAQMQWCVKTALLLPETQQWCSPVHAAPTWALPARPAPLRARGQGRCQWAGTFLRGCLWATPAPWRWASRELRSRNTEWAEKEKLSRFVIIQGIQPLIIMCNGELKSIKTKHWGGHWLSLFITTFPSAAACVLSWQKHFPATQELATQSAGVRGEPCRVWLYFGAGICHRERCVHKRADRAVRKPPVWRRQVLNMIV